MLTARIDSERLVLFDTQVSVRPYVAPMDLCWKDWCFSRDKNGNVGGVNVDYDHCSQDENQRLIESDWFRQISLKADANLARDIRKNYISSLSLFRLS